jgi:hypothetical protein
MSLFFMRSSATEVEPGGGGGGAFDEGDDTGTQWFVRPNGGAYGTENGTSWTNAFDGFADIAWASIAAGDTIWVAGGDYTGDLNLGASGNSSNPIKIRRARADSTACTSASGWNSSFDSTVHQVARGIEFLDRNWVIISGATTQSGGTQGWHIDFTGQTSGTGISWENGADGSDNIVRWIDVEGPGNVTYSSDGRGVDATSFSTAARNTIGHCKIHGWESTAYLAQDDFTFEYCEFYDVNAVNSATFHPNMVYVTSSSNLTFRYNHCHGFIGEGLFFTNNDTNVDTANIYGNIWENTKDGGTTTKCIQPDNTGTFTSMSIYNNTFDNCYNVMYGDSSFASSAARNNLVTRSGTGNPFLTGITASNNLVLDTDPNANNVYLDRAGGDYRIVSSTGANFPRDAGTALTTDGFINKDRNGNTRGADGTWDIGAYEYTA